jgi:hypothetical protein
MVTSVASHLGINHAQAQAIGPDPAAKALPTLRRLVRVETGLDEAQGKEARMRLPRVVAAS